MRLRGPLFAPGDSERKVQKALASEADAVILDLEDAVAAVNKDAARVSVAALLPTLARPGVMVRINPRSTPWYLADLAAVVPGRPAAILLPKCTGPDDLLACDHHLEALEAAAGLPVGGIRVLALVTETAGSLRNLHRYLNPPARLLAFCFGAEDLSADLGVSPRRADGAYAAPIAAARAEMLAMASACGVMALDTPWPDPRDPDGLRREAAAAVADGFAGKVLIHPAQIEPVHEAFTPAPEQVRWARAVRDGFAARPDAGTFALDGKMIDRPHLKLALRILEAAGETVPAAGHRSAR
jgi:citrate lyase subunit beta/citryl-CoA lyase